MSNSIEMSLDEQKIIKEFTADIMEALKSGLLPSDLSEEETKCMELHYGKKWYKKYGYTEKDFEK